MTSGPEIRPLLPHKIPMQTYSFAPPNLGLGDNKKSRSYFQAQQLSMGTNNVC